MAKFNLTNLAIAAAFALLLPLQKGQGVPCVTAFSTVSRNTPASTTPTRFARFGNDNNNHYNEPAASLVSRNGYVKTNKYDSTTVYATSRLFSSSSSRDVASLIRPRALLQAHVPRVWKRWIVFWATALQQWRKDKIQAPMFPWTMARCCSWRQGYKAVRRKVLCLLLSVLLVLGVSDAALAVTGGRAGGTFKSSHRPSVGRSYAPLSRPPRQYYSRPRPLPHVIVTSPSLPMSYNNQLVVARSAPSALGTYLAVGGVAGLVAYSTVQEQRRRGGGGSGSTGDASTYGATSTAITVALNIPNRDSPNSIVRRINEISKRTDTSTQSGVQMLISEGAFARLLAGRHSASPFDQCMDAFSPNLTSRFHCIVSSMPRVGPSASLLAGGLVRFESLQIIQCRSQRFSGSIRGKPKSVRSRNEYVYIYTNEKPVCCYKVMEFTEDLGYYSKSCFLLVLCGL